MGVEELPITEVVKEDSKRTTEDLDQPTIEEVKEVVMEGQPTTEVVKEDSKRTMEDLEVVEAAHMDGNDHIEEDNERQFALKSANIALQICIHLNFYPIYAIT